ncbi:MAG: ribosome-associated translation inhibitor RaiA [Pirellulales bacterium]|nr:ribosome-associated translation inhibitor RaiA [Pirellulales bacterium]
MQIEISVRHGSLSETSQAKITSKMERLDRIFDRLTAIDVTVNLEHKDAPIVDVRVSAEHRHDFVASHQAEELMAAVDAVIPKLEQQLRKYKEKVRDRHRGAGNREQEEPTQSGQASP